MARPAADGLFHKAILQSGASTGNELHLKRSAVPGVLSAEEAGAEFLSALAPKTATAKDLRAIPAAAIISRSDARSDLTGYFLPVVDGNVLPRAIGAAFRDGDVPSIPMIAGYNADEGTLFYDSYQSPTTLRTGIAGTLEEREKALAAVFGRNPAKALQALYGMDSLATWEKGATDMLGDDLFGVHMRYVGRKNAQSGAPTYLYHFTRVPPSKKQTIGAFHAGEIGFVFDNHIKGMKITDADRKLTQRMVTYWTNFARTGNPNGDGLPEWPATGSPNDVWLELGPSIKVIEGLRARKLDILEEALRSRIDAIAGPPPEPPPPSVPEETAPVVIKRQPLTTQPTKTPSPDPVVLEPDPAPLVLETLPVPELGSE